MVFFFNDTATTEIYTLSLHDALPISLRRKRERRREDDVPPPDRPDPGQGPEEAVIARDLSAAAGAVLGTLRPNDVETITAAAAGAGELRGATVRKRPSRPLGGLRSARRAR